VVWGWDTEDAGERAHNSDRVWDDDGLCDVGLGTRRMRVSKLITAGEQAHNSDRVCNAWHGGGPMM
jgi:hypothetical protein